MARLATAGGEIQDHPTTDIGSPDGYTPSTIPTVTATNVVRSGFASWLCAGTVSGDSHRAFAFTAPASGATLYGRMYFQVDVLPASTVKVATFLTAASGALISVRLTSAGAFQLWNDSAGTQIGSDTSIVLASPGAHYRVQVRLKIAAGAADEAELRVQVDASAGQAAEETVSGTALTISDTHAARFLAGWVTAPGVVSNLYLDDCAVNDSTGTKQNAWPGDGSVLYSRPIANGSALGSWTDCSGAASVYNGIENVPPVGLADHTNGADTGLAAHQIRCAVNTSQLCGFYCQLPQGAGVPMDLLVQTLSSGSTQTLGSAAGGSAAVAESFRFGAATTITGVGVYLYKTGTAHTDSVLVEIRTDSGGFPSNVVLAQANPISPSALSTTPQTVYTRTTLQTPFTAEAGTTYWLVVRRSGAADTTNNFEVGVLTTFGYPEGKEGELSLAGAWAAGTPSPQVMQMGLYTTNGNLNLSVLQGVVCHGQAVTGVKAATFTLTSPSGLALSGSFNFGDNVGVAGTYPSNWRWAKSTIAYDSSPYRSSVAGSITKSAGSGTNAVMVCAAGAVMEFQSPSTSWKRVQKTADSTFWQVKPANSPLTAELASGGIVTAEAGDWLIYPEPQVAAGGDLPATTTTISSDTLGSGYTDA